jgi:hypothetical protein
MDRQDMMRLMGFILLLLVTNTEKLLEFFLMKWFELSAMHYISTTISKLRKIKNSSNPV